MQKKRADSFESARFFPGGYRYVLKPESNRHHKTLLGVIIIYW